jgi:hypothetical protein
VPDIQKKGVSLISCLVCREEYANKNWSEFDKQEGAFCGMNLVHLRADILLVIADALSLLGLRWTKQKVFSFF